MKCRTRRGSALLEFVLTGIPLIFVWISTVQLSVGMWNYATLQYATKAATQWVATHGATYAQQTSTSPEVKDTATILAKYAIGMPRSGIQLTFTAYNSSGSAATSVSCSLDNCLTNTTTWPQSTGGYNCINGCSVKVQAVYQFHSAFGMFAPGASPVQFANSYSFPAYSHQPIVF